MLDVLIVWLLSDVRAGDRAAPAPVWPMLGHGCLIGGDSTMRRPSPFVVFVASAAG